MACQLWEHRWCGRDEELQNKKREKEGLMFQLGTKQEIWKLGISCSQCLL